MESIEKDFDEEPFLNYVKRRIGELLDIEMMFEVHQNIYGVPCGPTLSMVDPTKLAYYLRRDPEEDDAPEDRPN